MLLPVLKIGDLEIDEEIPNYFDCLANEDVNWSMQEEKYYIENYQV